MAVPSQTPVEVTLLPSGQTKITLAFVFTYVDINTISVSVNDVDLISTAYTVNGQNITFTPPLVGVTGGSIIKVYLDMRYSRDTDLLQSSPIFASDLNKQLDRLTLMVQQAEYGVNKGINFPPQDSDNLKTQLPVASLRGNRALVFDTDGSVNVSGDLYTNQVTLCEHQVSLATAQVSLATAQAVNSSSSAAFSMAWASQLSSPVVGTDYSAKYNALLAKDWANKDTDVEVGQPSAKTWAQTASAIAIPNGSIQPVKLNQTGAYVFGTVNSGRATSTYNTTAVDLCLIEDMPILATRQSLDRVFRTVITPTDNYIGFSNNANTVSSYIDFPIGHPPVIKTSTGINSPIMTQSNTFNNSADIANLTFNIMGINKTYTVSGEVSLPTSGAGSVGGSIGLAAFGLTGKTIAIKAIGGCSLSLPFGANRSVTWSKSSAPAGGNTINLALGTNGTEVSNGTVTFNITFTVL